jgi:hypothetical protein
MMQERSGRRLKVSPPHIASCFPHHGLTSSKAELNSGQAIAALH